MKNRVGKEERRLQSVLLIVFTMRLFFLLPDQNILANTYKGERIVYGIAPMGRAEYNDLGEVDLDGQRFGCVTFRTQAMGFDDTEKIYIDEQSRLPIKVERDVLWWLDKEFLVEWYDQKNFELSISKFKSKKMVKQYVFKEDGSIQNAILLPFYLRTIHNPNIGWEIKARLPEEFIIRLESFDEVKVPAGKFMTYHFTSIPDKFEVWISKDNLRLPVKIKGLGVFNYMLVMTGHFLEKPQPKEIK
ncbi:MAG: hypothetical protein HQL12_06740 [Candidatus Omnitrophica bacterium]|nr:hypothetical protein [Candidatus Omnitrophota bacterium]